MPPLDLNQGAFSSKQSTALLFFVLILLFLLHLHSLLLIIPKISGIL